MEVIVTSNTSIFGHDEQLLVVRPAETLDGAFVPLTTSAKNFLRLSRTQ